MIISGIFALLVGLLVFVSYRQGLKDGKAVSENKPVTPLFAPQKKIEVQMSDDEALLKWADSYEG